jgi:hypothetical protein
MRDLNPLPGLGRTFIGGFESTHLPAYGVDGLDLTGHAGRWRADIDEVVSAGVRCLRYPLRRPRIEPIAGDFRWLKPIGCWGICMIREWCRLWIWCITPVIPVG